MTVCKVLAFFLPKKKKKRSFFLYVVTQNLGREDTKFQAFFLEPENDKDAILLKLYKCEYTYMYISISYNSIRHIYFTCTPKNE